MRIAIWWQQEAWGGVDTHLGALLGAWPTGDEFTIFHNSGNPGLKRIEAVIAGRSVRTVAFPEWQVADRGLAVRLANYLLLPLRFGQAMRAARAVLESHGPFDALIADNGSYPGAWTSLAALWAAFRIGIAKRMLLVHHAAAGYTLGRRLFEQLVDRGVQTWTTDIVAVSRATRDTLLRLRFFDSERCPIRVIHNGIQLPTEIVTDRKIRESWGIAPETFVVGMVGRIERYKGHEDMLLALAELPEDFRRRVRLVIVGTGSEDEIARLRQMADRLALRAQVQFTDYVPGDSVIIAGQFDLLAMVTKDFEGFGLAIAEAMAAGTPVLATVVGAVSEFVTPEIATLVPPESPSDIARSLEAIMRDPAAAKARAGLARVHIENFSADIMSRRFHRLLSL